MDLSYIVLAYIPAAGYVALTLLTVSRQRQHIPDTRYELLNNRMGSNLTLSGFAFAVIGLLVSFFKDDLATISLPTYFFSVALFSFLASYILLYLRLIRLFDTLSDGLTNNGLWAISLGLMHLFKHLPELESISRLFLFLAVLIGCYVLIDIGLKWSQRNKTR